MIAIDCNLADGVGISCVIEIYIVTKAQTHIFMISCYSNNDANERHLMFKSFHFMQ